MYVYVFIHIESWISLTFSVEPTVDNRRFGRLLHPVIQNEQVFRDDADAVNVGNDRPRHDVEGREGKKSINASKFITFSIFFEVRFVRRTIGFMHITMILQDMYCNC